jgi:hypothetical protein
LVGFNERSYRNNRDNVLNASDNRCRPHISDGSNELDVDFDIFDLFDWLDRIDIIERLDRLGGRLDYMLDELERSEMSGGKHRLSGRDRLDVCARLDVCDSYGDRLMLWIRVDFRRNLDLGMLVWDQLWILTRFRIDISMIRTGNSWLVYWWHSDASCRLDEGEVGCRLDECYRCDGRDGYDRLDTCDRLGGGDVLLRGFLERHISTYLSDV